MPQAKVKWGSDELDVDVNLDESPLLLKAQLFELTKVPPERQKLIVRGKTIPDDSWNSLKIREGSVIMLVGSAESMSIISTELKDAERAVKERVLPVGLSNLGNTCYMNSSLQCFKVIPEFESALRMHNSEDGNGQNQRAKLITNSLKTLYNEMNYVARQPEHEEKGAEVAPFIFVQILRQTFPQFASKDQHGYQQQDANECFCELLRVVAEETVLKSDDQSSQKIQLKRLFEIEHDVTLTMTCKEDEQGKEEPQKSKENALQLSCYLEQEVRYIQSGIKNKMVEEIEKFSESLGRNAKYEKRSLISRLPAYLPIQMVRFYYKEDKKLSAKILKDVKFPIVLDVYELCTPELQAKLKPAREAFKEYEDTKMELLRKAKLAEGGDAKIELKPKEYFPNYFSDDIGSNNSGFYELKCLITHQGRSSNSGHYVAWLRVGDDEDDSGHAKWVVCDDANVAPVSEEEILKLSGGGDWHCAYVLLYGPKKIPVLDRQED